MNVSDVNRIRNAVPELEIITPLISRWGCSAINDNKQISVTVKGIHPEYGKIENPEIESGRMINDVDIKQERKVCIVGKRIVEELYNDIKDPCGKSIQVDGVYYKIVGISGKGSGSMSINGNPETSVTIPFTTIQRAYNRGNKIDLLCFTARKGYNIAEVQDKVEKIIKKAHNISPNDTQAVIKVNAEAVFGMIDNLFTGVSILVWMIGLGTLISGAIGVSNIMVVTVKERTTEIGIRRAIGATSNDILMQIMCECIVLTLVAGFSGISLGVLCLQGLENIAKETSPESIFQISFGVALGATLILVTLGIIAGLAPAYRALAIKPVDAMRDE
jgi:putative ABC transport system permease protein